MDYYLKKYIGKYRVVTELDLKTGDFCRDHNDNLCNDQDIYIKCSHGIRVSHYGEDILEVYIPSIGRGRNIIKDIYAIAYPEKTQKEKYETKNGNIRENIIILDPAHFIDHEHENDILLDGYETDEEVIFKIKDDDLDKIIHLLKPVISGASISPFSSRNIKKEYNEYPYTDEQIERYKNTISAVPKEDMLFINLWNKEFLNTTVKKELRFANIEQLNIDMKNGKRKTRDYIYYHGFEDKYISFMEGKINDRYQV